MILINYVLVVVILFGGYQMSYGEHLICELEDKSYWNWGSFYSCNVNSLENENNNKVITGFTGVHVGARSDNDVKMIHISETNAEYIPADIGKLFSLTAFYFGSSELLAIKSSDFDDMPDLKYLELGYNKLIAVPTCAFSKLTKLVYLSVFDNPVTKLPIGALSNNVNLKELWMSSSKINIDDNSLQLRKNMNGFCITSNESNAKLLESKNQEYLEATSHGEHLLCELEDKSYWNWGSYYSCNVNSLENGNNDKVITGFTGVHVGSRNYNDVKLVYISGTKAKYIPANIGKLFSLTSFFFGKSQLLAIKSKDFEDMQDLKRLELGWNQLTAVPADVFSTLTKLEYLSLFINQIEELSSDVFSKNVNLKEIWLTNNRIKFLGSGIFDGLSQLGKLDLNNNYCVSKTYSGIVKLQNDMSTMCKDSPITTVQDCEAKIREVQLSNCNNCFQDLERSNMY